MQWLLSDEPTLKDALNRAALVKHIGDTVAKCQPPMVFGVHGDWGQGKTSFLQQLQYYLSGDCPSNLRVTGRGFALPPSWAGWKKNDAQHCAVIWFEAWRYQHEPAPIVALLHEIRSQLPTASKLFNSGKKLAEVAIKSALFNLDAITKKIGFQPSKIQEAGERWEKEHLAEQLPSHTLREFLQQAVTQLLPAEEKGEPTPRIVVLVDDLDRCEPQTAYRLLEGIKIYLNLPNCVFILGVNQASIERSLAEQLAKEKAEQPMAEAKLRAREYLDKICRNFWHLPLHEGSETLINQWLHEALQNSIKNMQPPVGFYGRRLWYFRCLPNNPRRVKGYINTLARFIRHVFAPQGTTLGEPHALMCMILAYLYHFHPDLYQRVEWDPTFFNTIVTWSKEDEANLPKHELLNPLKRLTDTKHMATANPSAPTPAATTSGLPVVPPAAKAPVVITQSLHTDLSRASTFHMQLLIREFGQYTIPLVEQCLLK